MCYGLYWIGNNWPPQAKPYQPFGGKAPRGAAPVIQVEPVPVESVEAGAGEQKANEEVSVKKEQPEQGERKKPYRYSTRQLAVWALQMSVPLVGPSTAAV